MNHVVLGQDFNANLAQILGFIESGLSPSDVYLGAGASLFAEEKPLVSTSAITIPSKLQGRLKYLSHHKGEDTWQIIFSVVDLWYKRGADSLSDLGNPIVIAAKKLSTQLNYECHKLKAYLRFKEVKADDGLWYVSYHSCEHDVLPLVADFLVDRFRTIRWQVVTKHSSAIWDGKELTFGGGGQPSGDNDQLDDLWRTFYKATHNPDRLNLKLFKQHVPRKYWADMPEVQAVGALLSETGHGRPDQTELEVELQATSLKDLSKKLDACRRCSLWQQATYVVPGKGPEDAAFMIVGEQPGDQEDLSGVPFVGPAGALLEDLAKQESLDLASCYITNTVKHFRFESDGKARIHKRPGATHISSCRSWLETEISLIDPALIVCLGATATKGVLGFPVKMEEYLNKIVQRGDGRLVLITYHPAAILRASGERRTTIEKALRESLATLGNLQRKTE